MSIFSDSLVFKYPWRSYQERVLKELETHLDDQKLHVIAPPGSGKTILGLEVIIRLNCPTLVLAPTIAIRDQWVDRLCKLFIRESSPYPTWLSTNIKNPELLTITTYQALHALLSGKDKHLHKNNLEPYFDIKLGTIVADECHHLKNQWWQSLHYLTNEFPDITTVSLTATPPYDVNPTEFDRYNTFCGPVDAEISVPELVLQNDLCPHQDFVYLSAPDEKAGDMLFQFHGKVNCFFNEIQQDKAFIDCVCKHRFIIETDHYIEEILDNPAYYASILIFLTNAGIKLNKRLFNILGVSGIKPPPLDHNWLEILLTNILFNDPIFTLKSLKPIDTIKDVLKEIGAIERRKVVLSSSNAIYRHLSQHISKLDAISDIVDLETKALGKRLRLVILTDFIMKSQIPHLFKTNWRAKKPGIVPIFEQLRLMYGKTSTLGVLSGSLIVIPKSTLEHYCVICERYGLTYENIHTQPWLTDPDYIIVETSSTNNKTVSIITELFEAGYINILIGTKSLLGEGWDSPSINSLILASFVGSFVLSNQMRGRAIRWHHNDDKKVSNIWHLACIDPLSPCGGDDFNMLNRRFSAFLGPSNKDDVIERGLERLDLDHPPFSQQRIIELNNRTRQMAKDRDKTRDKWHLSLSKGTQLNEIVETPKTRAPKGLIFNNTIRALFFQGLYAGGAIFSHLLRGAQNIRNPEHVMTFLFIACSVAFIFTLPKTIRSLWRFLRNGPVEGSIKQIAHALLETLCDINIIKTEKTELMIQTEHSLHGSVYCSLKGASHYESSAFRHSLLEILNLIENPRYLISRNSFPWLWVRKDYHAVPTIIGRNKKYAETFSRNWKRYFGHHRLIFTRSEEGRKQLVKARGYALSSQFNDRSKIMCQWQ